MAVKRAMTVWYNPLLLIRTSIRVLISTIFGQFADKREALAAAANRIAEKPFDCKFDYSGNVDAFWLDYVADTGDGWESTFAVARLLAENTLTPNGTASPLPRGRVLIMGGDQVYPTASAQEYAERLLGPFEAAYRQRNTPQWADTERPDLYALPGNHDWYDGLSSFFHLFCRRTIKAPGEAGIDRTGTVVGGRQTRQTRSYFAIKLPHDWWLWGTDSQLEGYIDQPQVDYFQYVASSWMVPHSKVILCVGEPAWSYVDPRKPGPKFSTMSYLTRLAGEAPGMKHRTVLVLSGDSHHYARFLEGDLNFITCGGGGAFLHPTHHLRSRVSFKFEYPGPGQAPHGHGHGHGRYEREIVIAKKGGTTEEAIYPSRSTSWNLTWGNFLFAFRNWSFLLALFPSYLLFNWMLNFNAQVSAGPHSSLATLLTNRGFEDSLVTYWKLALVSPWPVLLSLMALGGYYYFADAQNKLGRFVMGALHFILQGIVVSVLTCWTIRWLGPNTWIGWSMAAASAISAVGAATVFGAYLWFSLAVLKRHWNEAFSSLRITGFKSFLRLRIGEDGALTVFAIGLHRARGKPHLIEPPLRISA